MLIFGQRRRASDYQVRVHRCAYCYRQVKAKAVKRDSEYGRNAIANHTPY
jgi:hypothetical protein